MKFRPCLDLHNGKVKQIVGSTLNIRNGLKTNFISDKDATWFAKMYIDYGLSDGHIIKLTPNSDNACLAAIQKCPQHFRVGGGINNKNAKFWLDNGAKAVITTSYIFTAKKLDLDKLKLLSKLIGQEKIIVDLSCAPDTEGNLWVYLSGWREKSATCLDENLIKGISKYCSGFLVHSIKNEGIAKGVDAKLIEFLGRTAILPVVYAGGVSSNNDIEIIKTYGRGMVDFTVGSALDIFGGNSLSLDQLARQFG